MKRSQCLFASVILLGAACTKDPASNFDCTGVTPTYRVDIKPILTVSCASSGCHSASSRAAGIDLSTYDKAKVASQGGRFLGAIQHLSGFSAMPQGASKLDGTKQQLLYCWVQNGSLE